MKLLLVSDIPPCTNYTAGLVLDQLCRMLPRGSIACSIVRNPDLTDAVATPDLDWIPIDYIHKPPEHGPVLPRPAAFLGPAASWARETYHETITCRRLVDRIARFGREFGADTVWCVLQGQTEIRIARPIAERLGARLLTMTWDPLYLWLDAHRVNRLTQRRVFRQYAATLRASDGFAAASWAMAEAYGQQFGVRSVPLVPGLDARCALSAARDMHSGGELVIGAAGKVYPPEIWEALLAALRSVDWTIAGRKVRLRVLCREDRVPWNRCDPVEALGWYSQHEAVRRLAEADVLFCPYWLDPQYSEITRLSFPGKLVTYLAAGRPVLFLGPDDASPAVFLRQHDAGLMCPSVETERILGQLRRLCEEPELYASLARNGRRAFDEHLTLEAVRSRLADFLRVAPEELLGGARPEFRAA